MTNSLAVDVVCFLIFVEESAMPSVMSRPRVVSHAMEVASSEACDAVEENHDPLPKRP